MNDVTLSVQRLASYREAIKKIKQGKCSLSFPKDTNIESILDFESDLFESDLVQLAAWLDARLDGFNKIQEIPTEISKGSVLDEVLNRIYDTFHEIIPYDRIGCALISDDYERVFAHWTKSNYPEKVMIKNGYTAFLSGSSLEGILTSQQHRILNDLQLYLAENPNSLSTKLIVAEGIQSSLTCPLIADGKPIGFIFFSSKEKNTYIDARQKIFINLARQISFLVEKSRLYQRIYDINNQLVNALAQLKEQSSRDALTGVFHRGAIMEFLKNTIEKDTRKKQPTTVILADIDHFKHVNDTYGHVAGDTALKEVSKSLTNHLRSHDCVGRYGGEEFLIILGETNATDALLIIERIRQAISDLKFERNEGNFSVTMSFGIACSDNTSHIKTEETLLLEADSALYHAKNEGRNRVCIA